MAVKLVVASDSHGSAAALQRVLSAEPGAHALLFLGDGVRDLEGLDGLFPKLRIYPVAGNCDLGCPEPQEGLAAFGGAVVFYTHGHNYGVKASLGRLFHTAQARGAQLALFGHTHLPCLEEYDGVTLFNPGSVGRPARGGATYGVIELEGGRFTCRHKKVPALWD